MEILIFDDLTTESALIEIETEGRKYEGLYVDMNNPPERKYVKEQYANIAGIIKKLDRARIDKSKAYKNKVEKEFESIKNRLLIANEPFSLLLDEWKENRAKILAAEKLEKEKEELKIKIEEDHEIALLMNKSYEFDRAEADRTKKENDAMIAKNAAELTIKKEMERQEKIKQDEINVKNARLANIEHVRSVNKSILMEMLKHGLEEKQSKAFLNSVAKKQVSYLTINY